MSQKKNEMLKALKKELILQNKKNYMREKRKKEKNAFPKVKQQEQSSSTVPPNLNQEKKSTKRKRMKSTPKDCSTEKENPQTMDGEEIEAANNFIHGNFKPDTIPVFYKHLNISFNNYRATYSESARTISQSNSN